MENSPYYSIDKKGVVGVSNTDLVFVQLDVNYDEYNDPLIGLGHTKIKIFETSLVALCTFYVMGKNVKLASNGLEKRLDAQRTKQMHNVNIQVFTSASTPGE